MKRLRPDSAIFKNVMSYCSEQLQSDPLNLDVLKIRAIALIAAGSFPDSISDLTRVIDTTPDDPKAYYVRSNSYAHQKEFECAYKDFFQAIALEFPEEGVESELPTKIEAKTVEEMLEITEAEKKFMLMNFLPSYISEARVADFIYFHFDD